MKVSCKLLLVLPGQARRALRLRPSPPPRRSASLRHRHWADRPGSRCRNTTRAAGGSPGEAHRGFPVVPLAQPRCGRQPVVPRVDLVLSHQREAAVATVAVRPPAGGLLALTIIALELGFVPTEIFPPSDTRFVQFGLQTPNGMALENTDRISRRIENAFRADPRVVAVASTVGQIGASGNTRSITNRASLQIVLKPGTSTTAFVQEWLARLKGTPKGPDSLLPASQRALLRDAMVGSIARGQPIDIVQSQISQGQTALELEIFGPDLNTLQTVSDSVMQTIARIPGAVPYTPLTLPTTLTASISVVGVPLSHHP